MSTAERFPAPELQPGHTIQFGDVTELHAFEDFLAPLVDPEYNVEVWGGRLALKELLRPQKFNGRMSDIALTVMTDPYERLLDAKERGWKIPSGTSNVRLRSGDPALNGIENFIGFAFMASAYSSGRGKVGQVQAELWYGPNPKTLRDAVVYSYQRQGTYSLESGEVRTVGEVKRTLVPRAVDASTGKYGRALLRVVTNPKIEKENFIELQESSRASAFSALQQNMMRPFINGMRK